MASGEAKKSASNAIAETSALHFASVASVAPAEIKKRIRLDRIIIKDREREPTQSAKENLAVSFREAGQLQDILVRPSHVDESGEWYQLVIGATRCGAAEICGWTEIGAKIRVMSNDEADLAEVDENLIRPGLTPHERAVFVAKRFTVWARLHPDRVVSEKLGQVDPITGAAALKRGRPTNADKLSHFIGDTPATMGFNQATAADLGLSPTIVKRALSVAKGLSPEAHKLISNTPIAKNEGLLRQLAGVADKAEQLRVVDHLVGETAKTFSDALQLANGRTPAPPAPPRPVDQTMQALMAVWKKAPPTHRAAFLDWLSTQKLPGDWSLRERADV